MVLLLVQLGDIHLKSTGGPVLNRADHIGSAIASKVSSETTSVVLALCGDLAFSGQSTEYEQVARLLTSVEDALRQHAPDTPVLRIAVPGNHDCDFSADQAARDTLLSSLPPGETPPPSVLDVVLQPLANYYKFAEEHIEPSFSISQQTPFSTTIRLEDGAAAIDICLLNTAWASQLREKQGGLHFPTEHLPRRNPDTEHAIAIVHHPAHWQTAPNTMRELQDWIAANCSMVLQNHEHKAEAELRSGVFSTDQERAYIQVDGGVLQDPSSSRACSFLTIELSATTNRLTITQFEYRESPRHFEATKEENAELPGAGPIDCANSVSLSPEMHSRLDDPGAPIAHPNRHPQNPIKLSDIFIYPDLWEYDSDHSGKQQVQVKSDKAAKTILGSKRALVVGNQKSGRSSIAKQLFVDAHRSGLTPVLLEGPRIPKKWDNVLRYIRQCVQEQYSNLPADAFDQKLACDRALIIDDAHGFAPASSARDVILKELEPKYGTIVLCGDDLIQLEEMRGNRASDSQLWSYRHFVIVGFGEYLRERFVRKWLEIDQDPKAADDSIQAETDRLCAILNTVIDKQLLPAYPLFLIVVLQQVDISSASVQGGSFGKLFEGVITAVLNKSEYRALSIGDKYQYLAALAIHLFNQGDASLRVHAAESWHEDYWQAIDLTIDYKRLQADLETLGVLSQSADRIHFRYPYYFCFFVAYYLSRRLHEPQAASIVEGLCGQLHHRISADIVLFLAHMTDNPIVMDSMIRTCNTLLAKSPMACFDKDVEPLNNIRKEVELLIPEHPDENRERLRLEDDKRIADRLAAAANTHEICPPEATNEELQRIFDIHASFKSIQILGQALRNNAGSTPRERKEEVLSKLLALARRILGEFLGAFKEESLPLLVDDMESVYRDQDSAGSNHDIRQQVCTHLYGLAQWASSSVIRHLSFSAYSQNLDPTIRRITSAGDTPIEAVVDRAFDLERRHPFPRIELVSLYKQLRKSGNRFGADLIRLLVAHHIYIYKVPVADRQAVCDEMEISLQPRALDSSRKRLAD